MVQGVKRKASTKASSNKKAKSGYKTPYGYGAPLTVAVKPRAELKFDIGSANTTTTTTGVITNLLTIPVGANQNERVGRRIGLHSMELSGWFRMYAGDASHLARLWIIQDRQPNGALPAFSDMFASTDPFAIQNQNFGHRFKILYTKAFTGSYDPVAGAYDNVVQQFGPVKIDLGGTITSYTNTTSGIASIEKNAVYAVIISSQNTTSVIAYNERFSYYDV